MAVFLSTYVNKVDRKGRVSVPVAFRNALSSSHFPGVVLFRSFKFDALEGFDYEQMAAITGQVEQIALFSDQRDELSSLFSESVQLAFDPEGRITLPDDLRAFANIADDAAFVGVGSHFQLWEPNAHKKVKDAARERMRANNLTLPVAPLSPAQSAAR